MGLQKSAWLEALNLGHENRYVQKLIERHIRSNARQEMFDQAGIKVKNDPASDALTMDDSKPDNANVKEEI